MLVILGALGMIQEGVDKHTNKISGCPSLYEIQKLALCGRVLSMWLDRYQSKEAANNKNNENEYNHYLPSS